MSAPPPSPPPSYQPGGGQPYGQVPSQPSWGDGVPAGSATTGELSGFWRRFFAYLIDGLILGVVVDIINGIIAVATGGSLNDTGGAIRGGIFILILGILYFGFMWSRSGKTLGYMALGIRLVREDGAPIGFSLAAGRYLLIWLSGALCLIPAIVSAFMIGFGAEKKAIHDHIVRTLVVRG